MNLEKSRTWPGQLSLIWGLSKKSTGLSSVKKCALYRDALYGDLTVFFLNERIPANVDETLFDFLLHLVDVALHKWLENRVPCILHEL